MNVSAIGIGGKLLYASHVNLFLKNCFGVVFYFIIPAINIYSRHLKKTLLNVLLPLWTNLKKIHPNLMVYYLFSCTMDILY